ncbi:hypothetical protein [Streptosporangium sp. NPDC050280]|uniref:hypothetical protein n=1 Tax=unclassified Streptosporangium TaxID=2632669 RepID=UPI00343DE548
MLALPVRRERDVEGGPRPAQTSQRGAYPEQYRFEALARQVREVDDGDRAVIREPVELAALGEIGEVTDQRGLPDAALSAQSHHVPGGPLEIHQPLDGPFLGEVSGNPLLKRSDVLLPVGEHPFRGERHLGSERKELVKVHPDRGSSGGRESKADLGFRHSPKPGWGLS